MPAVPSTLKKKRPRLLFSPGEAIGTNSKLLRESIGRWMLVALFDTGQRPVGRHERNVLQAEPTSVGQITQELRLGNVEMLPSIFWMTA